jgi:DNA polymerase III sliding clamp (beta) subunit (PCNA family)
VRYIKCIEAKKKQGENIMKQLIKILDSFKSSKKHKAILKDVHCQIDFKYNFISFSRMSESFSIFHSRTFNFEILGKAPELDSSLFIQIPWENLKLALKNSETIEIEYISSVLIKINGLSLTIVESEILNKEYLKNLNIKSTKKIVNLFNKRLENDLKKLSTSMSEDESRPVLNGIYFNKDDKSLVSTDAYRLTECLQYNELGLLDSNFILYKEEIKILKEFIKKSGIETSMIQIKDNKIEFNNENGKFLSLISLREYPKYRFITSMNKSNFLSVNFKELETILDKTALVNVNDSGKIYTYDIEIKKNSVSVNGIELKEYSKNSKLEETTLKINTKYLKDFISTVDRTETLKIEFNNNLSPIVSQLNNTISVVMPRK